MFRCSKQQRVKNDDFTILIVEDSRVINNTLATKLREKGYICLQSYDLAGGREILENEKIDLVILDLHLPDGEGEELVEEIRDIDADTKIVVFTSVNDLLRRDELFRLGILDYLQKGKNVNATIKELEHIIENIRINPNYTLLIVDDSRMIRKMMRNILAASGYNIIEAKNGKEALQKIEEEHVDLMLIDMQMPDMNGLDVIRQIKQNEQFATLPIFVISSTLDIESMRDAYKAGVLDYFKKPFSPEELKLKVEQIIHHKETEKDLKCSFKTAKLCNNFLNEYYASALFDHHLRILYANTKFHDTFGHDTPTLHEALQQFDKILIEDIMVVVENHITYNKKLQDMRQRDYLIKIFPIEMDEFLIAIEPLP